MASSSSEAISYCVTTYRLDFSHGVLCSPMKVTNINTRDNQRKLRAHEHLVDVGNGMEVGVSSYMLDLFARLQAILDDVVLEVGISGTRKQVNKLLDEFTQEYQRDD